MLTFILVLLALIVLFPTLMGLLVRYTFFAVLFGLAFLVLAP